MNTKRLTFSACTAVVVSLSACPDLARAQLRIVSYNTSGAPRAGMDFILRAIGQESFGGVQRPIDILLLQEQDHGVGLPDTAAFVNLLNNTVYPEAGFTYATGTLIGGGDVTQTIVYRTDTVSLFAIADQGEVALGGTGESSQPRQTLRYKVKPFGYDDSAAFYLYNSRYNAGSASEDPENPARRNIEAQIIRANSDSLGEGTHAIYAGDHSFYDVDSDEPAVGTLIASGPGQANDPLNLLVDWNLGSPPSLAVRKSQTQSPTTSSRYGGQAVSGLDDRFDFQWVTGEMLDHEGLSYITGTYHTFGNNGTTWNTDIDSGTNTYPFDGVAFGSSPNARTDLLTDLASVTDHLPVMADYQIPAKMGVQVASIPLSVTLNQVVPISVAVENIAPQLAVNGADELDYVLSVSGALTGGVSDTTPAASGPHMHDVFLNTSVPGLQTGMITVTATSQQASSPLFTFPVSFTVTGGSFLAADFNHDSAVDGADLQILENNFDLGTTNAQGDATGDMLVDGADLTLWQQQLGSPPPPATFAQAAVPEPAAATLALVALTLLRRRSA